MEIRKHISRITGGDRKGPPSPADSSLGRDPQGTYDLESPDPYADEWLPRPAGPLSGREAQDTDGWGVDGRSDLVPDWMSQGTSHPDDDLGVLSRDPFFDSDWPPKSPDDDVDDWGTWGGMDTTRADGVDASTTIRDRHLLQRFKETPRWKKVLGVTLTAAGVLVASPALIKAEFISADKITSITLEHLLEEPRGAAIDEKTDMSSPFTLPEASPETLARFAEIGGDACSPEEVAEAASIYDGVFGEELPTDPVLLEPIVRGALRDFEQAKAGAEFVDVNADEFQALYDDAESETPQRSVAEYQELLDNVLKQVGITAVNEGLDLDDENVADDYRNTVVGLVWGMLNTPKALIVSRDEKTGVGVDTITIFNEAKTYQGAVLRFPYSGATGSEMRINVNKASIPYLSEAFRHENAHLFESYAANKVGRTVFEACLSIGFNKLNPPGFKYGEGTAKKMEKGQSKYGSLDSNGALAGNFLVRYYGAIADYEDIATTSAAWGYPNPYDKVVVKQLDDAVTTTLTTPADPHGERFSKMYDTKSDPIRRKLALLTAEAIANLPDGDGEYLITLLRLQRIEDQVRHHAYDPSVVGYDESSMGSKIDKALRPFG